MNWENLPCRSAFRIRNSVRFSVSVTIAIRVGCSPCNSRFYLYPHFVTVFPR